MSVTGEGRPCAYPWQQMIIDLTGEVVPCCFWSGYGNSGKPLGNTNEHSLDEIWNGPAYRELRDVHASGKLAAGHPCHECMAWTWSGGAYPGFSWPVAFERETGSCFIMRMPERFLAGVQASDEPALLFEDDEPLPLPDALHDDIRALGGGRYSVWGETLYFSSSDGSDPGSNGRVYELRCGEQRARLTNLVTDSVSGRNILAAHEEYEQGAEELQAKPSMVSFIATSDCNIDCPGCSQNLVRLLRVQHRPETELDVLAHVPYLHQFIWHGGEPYLIRRFRDFIDAFERDENPNLTFGFTSNGTLLDKEELEKLVKFPRINASISIDSFVEETFHRIRAGAVYKNVLRNTLRAVAGYDAPYRVFSVGMIINKANFTELPANLRFAMEHDIGLNLSPVVVVPVHDRLDVFTDFARQTRGWQQALDACRDVLEKARAEGRAALRRVDPRGMIDALQDIYDRSARRYARVFPMQVVVRDPLASLEKMRRPGLVVARDGEHDRPLAYLPFDGPGVYTVMLPRAELRGDLPVSWFLLHDLDESMGIVDAESFRDEAGNPLNEVAWRVMPTELRIDVPPFEPVVRARRNIQVANFGLPTSDGLAVFDNAALNEAYARLMLRETREGHGVRGEEDTAWKIITQRARRVLRRRYASFEQLGA